MAPNAGDSSRLDRFARDVVRSVAIDVTKAGVYFVGASVLAAAALLVAAGGTVPAWTLAAAVVGLSALGVLAYGRVVSRLRGEVKQLAAQTRDIETESSICVDALVRHETYSRHVAEALDALQLIVAGDLAVAIPPYIEDGVLEPARDLMTEKPAERVRLSVLLPDGDRWKMVFAAGHSLKGKTKYDERIIDTLARHAYESGVTQHWADVTEDSGFKQNPDASFVTRALVSLPLRRGDETIGVLNVVSSEPYAFDPAEETYIASLGAVIAVAVGVHLKDQAARSVSE